MKFTERLSWKKKIEAFSQTELAKIWRFEPRSNPIFSDNKLLKFFRKEFREKGGMTSEISEKIGWGS